MRFHSRRASPRAGLHAVVDDHHPRLMQTVIFKYCNGEVLVTDLKLWWNAIRSCWLLPPVARRSGFRCIYLNPFQHATNQAEVSLAADQSSNAPPQGPVST